MKTFRAKSNEIESKWYLVDAKDKVVGRLASEIADILAGKKNVTFTKGVNCGDFVVVINAEKVVISGKKFENKIYYSHTGFLGSLGQETFKDKLAKHPEEIIIHAVKGMLPHNILGRDMLRKLKVYKGGEHPHSAQNPQELVLKG
ncbi:50S ribosomal protein L13 [bacterium]|nr:50S ribosomal protein L13 [bacterium]